MPEPMPRFRRSRGPCSAMLQRTPECGLSAPDGFSLARYIARVGQVDTMPPAGRVIRSVGLLIESAGPRASVGEICEITGAPGEPSLPVQVVGFRDGTLLTVPLGDTAGVRPGERIVARTGAV